MNTLAIVFLICFPWQIAAKDSPPLVIAVEDDAAPWSFADGSGFANEVVRAAFDAAGVEISLNVVPYARCKDMALNGTAPACFSMAWIPELAGRIEFAEKPIFSCQTDYFIRSQGGLKARDEKSLPKGTRLGVVIGYEYPPSMAALEKKGILILEESESEELNLKKLAAGRVDAALINHNQTKPAELILKRAGVMGQVRRAFKGGTQKLYIGFSLAHPRGAWAKKNFDRGFKLIAYSGRLKKIESQWKARAGEKTR